MLAILTMLLGIIAIGMPFRWLVEALGYDLDDGGDGEDLTFW